MKKRLIAVIVLAVIAVSSAFACTGVMLKAQDGSYINGRTLEFGIPIDTIITIIPHNYAYTGALPNNQNGMSFKAKYAVVGGSLDNGADVQDGLNEKGLSVGAFYFSGYAGYAPVTTWNKNKSVSPLQFPTWLLTQFSSVAEVKAAIEKNDVSIAPTVFASWGIVPPLHYIVYDRTGASLVIEPINGKLVTYDDPLGVFTNSPTFDWHMTNLGNYINISPINVGEKEVNGLAIAQFGQGSGMHGLPGDFTSPSRFVRAAFFEASALPAATAQDAVFQVFHILNQFDIPMGSVRDMNTGKMVPEYTMATIVRDPVHLDYYFRTYQNQDISVVHLKSFDWNATTLKHINAIMPQGVTDVSSSAS